MTVAGVDGCRGQWLAAISDGSAVSWRLVPSFRDLYDDTALTVIAIDVPIGLPESGSRACDVDARKILCPLRASVFAAPVRPVLEHRTYPEARAALAVLGQASMSAQAPTFIACHVWMPVSHAFGSSDSTFNRARTSSPRFVSCVLVATMRNGHFSA